MKRLFFFLSLVWIVACKSDFDEMADTDQRSVRFHVYTSQFFDKVLSFHDKEFSLGYIKQIQPTHRLRLISYCYDENGSLVNSQTLYYEQPQDAKVLFKHLQKQQTYRFVFIADIVKYDATFNCYETWYQLLPQTLSELYLVSFEEDEVPEYNVVLSSVLDIEPANQMEEVMLEPQTWNGYLNFANVNGIDKLSGDYTNYRSFFFESKEKRGRLSLCPYDIAPPKNENNVVIPMTFSIANDLILFENSAISIEGAKDTVFYHYNTEHAPFVITFDCQSNEISYENYH